MVVFRSDASVCCGPVAGKKKRGVTTRTRASARVHSPITAPSNSLLVRRLSPTRTSPVMVATIPGGGMRNAWDGPTILQVKNGGVRGRERKRGGARPACALSLFFPTTRPRSLTSSLSSILGLPDHCGGHPGVRLWRRPGARGEFRGGNEEQLGVCACVRGGPLRALHFSPPFWRGPAPWCPVNCVPRARV